MKNVKLEVPPGKCAIAFVQDRNFAGYGYFATIRTGRGRSYKGYASSAPWNALRAAADKWAKDEMDRLTQMTPEG